MGHKDVLIVASRADPASMNIADKLLDTYGLSPTGALFENSPIYVRGHVKLVFTSTEPIYAEHVEEALPEAPEAIIFASRHASARGEPTLSTHTPGNLGFEAEHGGRPRELAISDPLRMKSALISLSEAGRKESLEDFSICLEATHHGPTGLSAPTLFVEIGSTPDKWADPLAGEAVAEAIWEAATRPARAKRAVGLGGGHYAPKLTAAVLEMGLAIGHIVPKYVFQSLGLDRWLIEEPVKRTHGGCEAVVIDKKGLRAKERRFAISVAEDMGLEVVLV